MAGEKKYLRRIDTKWWGELELSFLETLRVHLEQAGLPYEVLDAPPKEGQEEGENTNPRRRRSS